MPEAIGSFSFVQLEGVPVDASGNPIIRFESRFGVDDVVIFKEALKRGVPYPISAFRDVSTIAAATSRGGWPNCLPSGMAQLAW